MIIFWILLVATILWAFGSLAFFYHGLSFRFPKDVVPGMLALFVLIAIPALLLLFGFLSDTYGGL